LGTANSQGGSRSRRDDKVSGMKENDPEAVVVALVGEGDCSDGSSDMDDLSMENETGLERSDNNVEIKFEVGDDRGLNIIAAIVVGM
jgi:hypothetical protein